MADEIRSLQNIAQVEWQKPDMLFSYQTIAQVEYVESTGWTGKVNGLTNPAKINGVAVADINKVMGIS